MHFLQIWVLYQPNIFDVTKIIIHVILVFKFVRILKKKAHFWLSFSGFSEKPGRKNNLEDYFRKVLSHFIYLYH